MIKIRTVQQGEGFYNTKVRIGPFSSTIDGGSKLSLFLKKHDLYHAQLKRCRMHEDWSLIITTINNANLTDVRIGVTHRFQGQWDKIEFRDVDLVNNAIVLMRYFKPNIRIRSAKTVHLMCIRNK